MSFTNKIIPYNPNLLALARKLRSEVTLSEVLLWQEIRRKRFGVEFHRQVPINEYIVDFYCHELKLAIEIDGNSHDQGEVHKNDIMRQNRLEEPGTSFLRFADIDVKRRMQLEILNRWKDEIYRVFSMK